jgi:hypothetical protein|tara:strand:- start:392 stop:589 length:198 start_codon:yes stop_codon:yes gene_type:complete
LHGIQYKVISITLLQAIIKPKIKVNYISYLIFLLGRIHLSGALNSHYSAKTKIKAKKIPLARDFG